MPGLVALIDRTGGSRHAGQAAPPPRNIRKEIKKRLHSFRCGEKPVAERAPGPEEAHGAEHILHAVERKRTPELSPGNKGQKRVTRSGSRQKLRHIHGFGLLHQFVSAAVAADKALAFNQYFLQAKFKEPFNGGSCTARCYAAN